jgi:aspartate/methionine/tyrosine aminotransferase
LSIHLEAQDRNDRLAAISPVLAAALAPLGRRMFFPKGIPYQAGQAKGCAIDGTIGQITDGAGQPLPLAPLREQLPGLDPRDAFLYSPIGGRDKARKLWHAKLLKEEPGMARVALPTVGAGICHALSMAAELFFAPGDTLVLPDLYWDNYEQVFQIRLEGRFLGFPFYGADGGFNVEGLRSTLAGVTGKVQILLNFPSNPNGYSPTQGELQAIAKVLVEAAAERTVVVYCDDAYHGLVFDPKASTRSLFYELLERSPNLIPLKCDGATKELSFFGGRVGFLSFGVAPEAAAILHDKCMGLIRSAVGGPVGISQALVEVELADPRHEAEFEGLRRIMAGRYQALRTALDPPSRHWKVFPFNAGCFCLLELRPGLNADAIRQQLIREEGVGVVSQGDRYIRIAFCSLREDAIPPLIEALSRVCGKQPA